MTLDKDGGMSTTRGDLQNNVNTPSTMGINKSSRCLAFPSHNLDDLVIAASGLLAECAPVSSLPSNEDGKNSGDEE